MLLHSEVENRKLMKVHYSKERPFNAFTAVKYRDYWYWVDDRDFRTKRTFAMPRADSTKVICMIKYHINLSLAMLCCYFSARCDGFDWPEAI